MGLMTFLNGNPSKSYSTSEESSTSKSGGQSSSSQEIAFNDLFQQLFGGAAGAAGKVASLMPNLTDQVSQLFNGGMDTLKNLGGGAGAGYIDNRLNGAGTVDASIDALGTDLGRFFDEKLNPGLRLGAAANGTLGGDRSEVARGVAAGDVARSFTTGAAQLRAADQSQRDQLATSLMSNNTQNAGLSLSALPELAGLAQGGATSGLLPYTLLASIMGNPTVLGQSSSSNFADSSSTGKTVGEATGAQGGIMDAWSKFWSFGGGGGGKG